MSTHAAPRTRRRDGGSARGSSGAQPPIVRPLAVFAWAWVGIPFGYGVYQLLTKIDALFAG